VGLAVTLALLAWALHGVDAGALVGHLRRADPWLVLATIVLATHAPHLLGAVSGRQIALRAGHLVDGGAAVE